MKVKRREGVAPLRLRNALDPQLNETQRREVNRSVSTAVVESQVIDPTYLHLLTVFFSLNFTDMLTISYRHKRKSSANQGISN